MALFYQSPTRNLPDGYTFRGATLNDIPVVAYLFNQRQMTLNTAEMRKNWHSPALNPALDVRLVLDQREQLIGYIEVWTTPDLAGHPWLWGCVHPAFENRGIGTAMLRWAEARVRLAMELLPENLRVAPRFVAQRTLKTAPALCEALGWQPVMTDLTNTARLPENTYDIAVYEKEIRSGTESFPVAI